MYYLGNPTDSKNKISAPVFLTSLKSGTIIREADFSQKSLKIPKSEMKHSAFIVYRPSIDWFAQIYTSDGDEIHMCLAK